MPGQGIRIEDPDAAGRDHAEDGVARGSERQPAHREHVERRRERPGDFVGDRDASARKAEDHDVAAGAVDGELAGQEASGLPAIHQHVSLLSAAS